MVCNIWGIISALTGLAIGLFAVLVLVAYIVFFIKELKKLGKE